MEMTGKHDLMSEADQIVSDYLEQNPHGECPKSWLVNQLIQRHPLPEFDDRDWHEHNDYIACHEAVGKVIRRRKIGTETGDPQAQMLPGMEGYECLQKIYSIERDGEPTIVHVWGMTEGEVRIKADEMAKVGNAFIRHSRELIRSLDDPRRAAAA